MKQKISVVIPARNEEGYIKRTLFSLLNQTFQDFEIIVVANGCTDKTEELVRKRENKRLKLYSLTKANVSLARNFGAKMAKGELLVFLDADTLLNNDALQKINNIFSDEEIGVATTKVLPDSDELKFKLAMMFKNVYNSTGIYKGCGGVLCCRTDNFDDVKGYDELKVREHRKLILKLLAIGKYKCVDTYAITSMRRLKDWGLSGSALFWAKQFVKDKLGNLKGSDYEMVR